MEPILTSFPQPPMSPAPKPPFDKTKLLIPGAILVWWLRRYLPDSRLKRILFFSWKV